MNTTLFCAVFLKQPEGLRSVKPAGPTKLRPKVAAAASHSAAVRLCRPVVSQSLLWLA